MAENELYMIDIRLELGGANAVEAMRLATDAIIDRDNPNAAQIAIYLGTAARAIEKMTQVLMSTTKLVPPKTFFHEISPWLRGSDTDPLGRFWVWQGAEDVEGSTEMLKKTSTPTAAQSPLIPALDAYLGLDESEEKAGFLNRVSAYMIRQHQTYLQEIRSGGRPIRTFVEPSTIDSSGDPLVVSEYNAAAAAIKRFRDAHLMIVSKYIIVPDRKAKPELTRMGKGAVTSAASGQHREGDNQGVGKPAEVASLIATLKAFRDQAAAMLIE